MGKQDVRQAVWDFLFGCCRKSAAEDPKDGITKPTMTTATQVSGLDTTSHVQADGQPTVDELGLPIQGSNFQFLDEASSRSLATSEDDVQRSPA